MKKYAYLGKGKKYKMLKITANVETAKENAPYVETDIEFKKERENQVGGNPYLNGKELFVYDEETVCVDDNTSEPIKGGLDNYPALKAVYEQLAK